MCNCGVRDGWQPGLPAGTGFGVWGLGWGPAHGAAAACPEPKVHGAINTFEMHA